MRNPMLNQLNQSRITPIINAFKSGGNPQALLSQMPQYRQVMDYVNANGGDPRKAFYKMASEMGINPDDVLNSLR